ncbi:MAG: hypothetical protein RLZZ366_562 [Pseudomonadota bacterium]|jgi:hypothetical protein
MKRHLILIAFACVAATPRSPNLLRDALTPVAAIVPGKALALSGTTDGKKAVSAQIDSAKTDARLTHIAVSQDGHALLLPEVAYADMKGANRAWLAERGALTTLVIEGVDAGKDWRLALEFHPKQLWLRRLSQEGVNRDAFTYFDRDDATPQRIQWRRSYEHGFNQD